MAKNWAQMRYEALRASYERGELTRAQFLFFTDEDARFFTDDGELFVEENA